MTNDSFGVPHRLVTSASRAAFTLLLAASLLSIGRDAAAQQQLSDRPPFADSTGESDVYPVGDAVDVYRAVLDLLYIDGNNRPSVIVLRDTVHHRDGGPCTWRCTEPWPHQSTIDTATILGFTQQSWKHPRIIDFGYRIPIVRIPDGASDGLRQLGYGYLAHLPPGKVGPGEAFYEGLKRKYPGAWGRLALGKVGFNPEHTEALVRVHQWCSPYCRNIETVFLKRAGQEWRVVERIADSFMYLSALEARALHYRGPLVRMGQRSQVVATDVSAASPRAQSAAPPRVQPAVPPQVQPAVPPQVQSAVLPQVQSAVPPRVQSVETGKTGYFSGLYTSGAWENMFSPCDVPGIGSGWAVRFKNPSHGGFLQYQYPGPGGPPTSHFIRVRGRVSAPGRYGIGFQGREIVVDSVLAISETHEPCTSYEDLPQPWSAVPASGSSMVGATVSEDGTIAAVLEQELEREGEHNTIITIWDVARGVPVRKVPALDTGRLARRFGAPLALSRDGKLFAAGGPDGVVRVWNVSDGRPTWTLVGDDAVTRGEVSRSKGPAPSTGLTFNESGTLLANTFRDRTVLWSMASGERLGGHDVYWSDKFLFLHDSSFITGGDSGLVNLYSRPGAPPTSIKNPGRSLEGIHLSPDRRWLVIQGWRGVRLLSLPDGVPGHTIAVPSNSRTTAIAFSPDGNTIAISGGAYGLYLWDTRTGLPVRSFQRFPSSVEKAWFTADGRSIVTYVPAPTGFRIVHLHPEKHGVGVETKRPKPVEARANLPPRNVRQHPRSVSGFVRDSAGNGIVRADVSLYDGDRPGSARIARVSTNAAGYYLVENVAPTHVVVQAEKPGFARETIYVHVPTRWIDKDLKMRKTGR